MAKTNEDEQEFVVVTAADVLHGDMLDSIISHVSLIHLLPAYYVSPEWQSAVRRSLRNPSRSKPWLILHIQSSHNPSLVVTRACDPESHVWVEISRGVTPRFPCLPMRSSHSNILYTLTASKLCFSSDALGAKWHEVDGPKIWRSDPVVAKLGPYLVVAGGTCDFEDHPLAVEIYDPEFRQWEICQSMPHIFECHAASTWLSVAVSGRKMFLLEKTSGTFSTFDSKTKVWERVLDIWPDKSLFFSLIGFSKDRLLLVGLVGEPENVESLRIWEVNLETFYCQEVSKMPCEMLEQLMESCFSPSAISISVAGDIVYVCDPSNPDVIILCELSNDSCHWTRVQSVVANGENLLRRFVFTCSRIGINDLQMAFPLISI